MLIGNHLRASEVSGTETDARLGKHNPKSTSRTTHTRGSDKDDDMKRCYLIVRVGAARLVTYVQADSMASAFKTGNSKCRAKHPKLNVEVLTGQEVSEIRPMAI